MKLILIVLILSTFLSDCNFDSTSTTNLSKVSKQSDTIAKQKEIQFSGLTYRFDSNSFVSGCGDAIFQKISKDYKFELLVELKFDSISKFQDIDFNTAATTISISLYKYSDNNNFINDICNDAPSYVKDQKPPKKFIAVSGSLAITEVEEKRVPYKVSILLKNILLKDTANNKIFLPNEEFKDVLIGWNPG